MQVTLIQATVPVKGVENPHPNQRQACSLILVNLPIYLFIQVPKLIAGDERKGLKSLKKGIYKN